MGKVNVYDIDGKSKGEVSVDTIPAGFEPDRSHDGIAMALTSSAQRKTLSNPAGFSRARAMLFVLLPAGAMGASCHVEVSEPLSPLKMVAASSCVS